MLSQIFWEDLGLRNIENPAFNDEVWRKIIVRYPEYRKPDRVTVHKHQTPPTPVEITRRVVKDQLRQQELSKKDPPSHRNRPVGLSVVEGVRTFDDATESETPVGEPGSPLSAVPLM